MKNNSLVFSDFFGTSHSYFIYGVKSSLSILTLCNQLRQHCFSDFCYLGELDEEIQEHTAHFKLFFSVVSKEDKLHLLVIENETSQFTSHESQSDNQEGQLSLFSASNLEEHLYLFNSVGTSLFKCDVSNLNYLFFIYIDKGRTIQPFIECLSQLQTIKINNMSNLLDLIGNSREKRRVQFIQELFFNFEGKIQEFQLNEQKRVLFPNRDIPKENYICSQFEEFNTPITISDLSNLTIDITYD